MGIIDDLKWRCAIKKFDSQKKVSNSDLELLKKAIQLSPSSFGLQLYKILIITNQKIKIQLRSASFEQSQITDCSHLFVFCNYTSVNDHHIDEFAKLTSEIQKTDTSKYSGSVKQYISSKTEDEKQNWMANQVYIAAGNFLTVCASLKIDTCPIGGIIREKYNQILGLTEKGLNTTLSIPIGYRSSEDEVQHREKVRRPFETLFKKYD